MKVTVDDLKKDIEMIIKDLDGDYEAPSAFNIFWPIFKMLSAALIVQAILSVIDFYLWGGGYRGGLKEALILYFIGMVGVIVLPSIVLTIVFYTPVMIVSCLSNEAKRRSIILKIAKSKLMGVLLFVILFNSVVGVCFVLNESAMIVFMGGVWFASALIATQMYNILLVPYFTPAVVRGITKVKDLISAPTK